MNRRTLLAGTVGALGLSGCLSAEADGETTLGGLVILSYSTEQTLVDVRIDWGGETVHDSTYTIEPDGAEDDVLYDGAVPERSWPDEPGQFTLYARIAGEDEWQTLRPEAYDYPECLSVDIRIREGPRVSFYTTTDTLECEDDSIPN